MWARRKRRLRRRFQHCQATDREAQRDGAEHQAAQRDGLGWIMSGLHNPRSESAWRITPQNFDGIVRATFVWTP